MPRKKPTATNPANPTNIHQRIARAAHLFTQEILQILGSSTLEDLTSLSGGGSVAPARLVRAALTGRRSLEFLKSIGRIAVGCPVPGCTARGVRSKMNFCQEHAQSIPRQEQLRLRAAQKAQRIADRDGDAKRLPPKQVPKGGKGRRRTAQPAVTA